MRAFPDLLETVTPAATTDAARNLTTVARVKTALRITDSNTDALITDLIPRVTQLIANNCKLARDGAGSKATFAIETLRATWYVDGGRFGIRPDPLLSSFALRGSDIYLPWRLPVTSVDTVTEDGNALTAGTDYALVGSMAGRLTRISGDSPAEWSSGKVVVTYKAGFASVLSVNVDQALEAAAIEQVKYMLFAANRDPAVRMENVYDVAQVAYSVPGGDVMGANVLLPSVRDMLADWRKPTI